MSDAAMAAEPIDEVLAGAVDSGALRAVAAGAWADDGSSYLAAFGQAGPDRPMTPDTVVWIASMTKAVTAAVAMGLVEQGALDLDEPLGAHVPYLAEAAVLEGLDADGTPRLRPPTRPVTLRHLLTHTAGFAYDFADPQLAAYVSTRPAPPATPTAGYQVPLLFDPGERWCYGIGIDWAGKVIEAVLGQPLDEAFDQLIFRPLGMHDTGFARSPEQVSRTAEMNVRGPDGLNAIPFDLPVEREFFMAGGGLYSTVPDYLRFTRMLLSRGTLDGVQVLAPETVELMARTVVDEGVSGWTSVNPMLTNDVDLTESGPHGWSLSFLVNAEPTPEGRSAGSLAWAGLANTYYWVDFAHGTTGVFATQVLPFYDDAARRTFKAFETAVQAGAGGRGKAVRRSH